MTERRDAAIDVERLVADLRERVARRRAAGEVDDLTGIPLDLPPDGGTVRFRPELAYSTKPLVGRPLTAMKRVLLRLLVHVFDDLARQTSTAVERAVGEARDARRWAEDALEAEAAARQRVELDVAAVSRRIEALERLELGVRTARLERASTRAAAPAHIGPAAAPPPLPSRSPIPFDYAAFKARFGGSADEVRARQAAYLDDLSGRRRVVDLGCGHGELLAALREAGTSAYGVETDADFVQRLREAGLEVVEADALAHLRSMEPGAVDGIVASHVIEHLPPEVAVALIDAAWEALPEDGVLVLDTPNPESVLAGSVNFHRDPTHVSPVHPDTLAFLCEMAGFSRVEIRRLSPVPTDHQLPAGGGDGPVAERLDRIVAQLNDLLYGFQDYAVLAWR